MIFFEKVVAAKIEIRKTFGICVWVLGRDGKSILTRGGLFQLLNSILEVVFLALIAPLILLVSSQSKTNTRVSVLGFLEFNSIQIVSLLLLVISFKSIFSLTIQRWVLNKFAQREAEIVTAFVERSLFENIELKKSSHSVDLTQVVNNVVGTLFNNVFKPAVGFFGDITIFLSILIALSIFRPAVAAITFTYFLFIGFLFIMKFGDKQQKLGTKTLLFEREAMHIFSEIRLIGQELRFSNREAPLLKKFFDQRHSLSRNRANSYLITAAPRYVLEFFLVSGITIIMVLNTFFGSQTEIMPTLGLMLAAGFRILPSINSIIINIISFKNSRSIIYKIDEMGKRFGLRDTDINYNQSLQRSSNLRFEGDLVFQDTSFKYNSSQRSVLTNFNARIAGKSVTLIQGVNGSGKTTLISLALGLLKPTSGSVYLEKDGVGVPMLDGISGIRYVSQEVGFLSESIGHNIALRPISDSDIPKLTEVCSKIGILDRILGNQNGFGELVGENGMKLSAGERQRLGIARALFESPELLILDEPTANLDSLAEEEVWSALQNLKGDVTMLIVSHRKVPDSLYDYKIGL